MVIIVILTTLFAATPSSIPASVAVSYLDVFNSSNLWSTAGHGFQFLTPATETLVGGSDKYMVVPGKIEQHLDERFLGHFAKGHRPSEPRSFSFALECDFDFGTCGCLSPRGYLRGCQAFRGH